MSLRYTQGCVELLLYLYTKSAAQAHSYCRIFLAGVVLNLVHDVLIQQLRDQGMSVLLVEHHMRVVMGACDRVVVLNFGRKIAEGAPETVQNDEHVRAAYLGSDGSDDLMHAALAA